MGEESNILAKIGECEIVLIKQKKEKDNYITQKHQLMEKIDQIAESINLLKSEKKETQKSIDTINLSVEEHEEKLKSLEEKRMYILTGGGKNADLELIKEQIAEENADRSKLEDEIYALWEKVEGVESRIDQTKIDLGRIRHEVDIKAGEIDLEIKRIDGEIAKLNGLIDERLEILNKENAEAYNFFKRLQTKEIIPSAVQLKGSACCGCSCSLPIDVQNKIKEGQLVKCPLCNRFLYYIEEVIDDDDDEEQNTAE